jgi:hypothetical protein
LIIGTLGIQNSADLDSYFFWNMSDTNRSADEQARHPMVWVGVITLEQKPPLAIANIKESS